MGDWPDGLKVGPIREWPGEQTRERKYSPFRGQGGRPTPLRTTLDDLDRELFQLGARDVELLVAVSPEKFRLDGKPRAGATATHPGIILSFEIPEVGKVSYPCDTFTTWEDNLRAVTLALEALRKIDRYGVTKHGQQYRGFRALEATAAPAGFSSTFEASEFLAKVAGVSLDGFTSGQLLRLAQRSSHPDRGGDAAIFQRVSLAEAKLREAGEL